ncbi:MAG: hypothetical protein MJZ11_03620 [Lachnospiraceae bacterium]|nr:hypothetical protein [Lachnospiraceae bacterium]
MVYEQLISKKSSENGFSVERDYVNKKAYHDKFERLPLNKSVYEMIYKETGRLLEYVDGQSNEYMIAINGRTGEFIVDNLNRPGDSSGTTFNEYEMAEIEKCEDSIILIHNHSYNRQPSGKDIASYAMNDKVKISIIACHNGDVYAIIKANKVVAQIYNELFNEFPETYSKEERKTRATKILEALNGLGNSLYEVWRL